ncbi:uncharacterized protein [Phaseolus vulgaris]|uniref:uncharacterized protein n=1 Tax=Phaseolus vulgaris TaxID=3885 RepID=UPI0035CB0BDA
MGKKIPFGEGASIYKPHLFFGLNYQFWKVRMKIFVESIDRGIWDAIINEPFIPMLEKDKFFSEKSWSQWTENESKKAQYDGIAKNIITPALNSDEFFRVSQCGSAKQMWDILEVTHEGTIDVKRAWKHNLIQDYEMFRMLKGETISDVNHLTSLGKIFEREELNIKILKCLDRSWQPKVTTISESKDLTTLTRASLFGKLREHELEMNWLNDQEHEEKCVRSIALRVVGHRDGQDSSECSDGETLNLLTRKFSKFLKKKSRDKSQPSNRYNSKSGHIKAECPSNVSKENEGYKKYEKKSKTRRAYNNDSYSSSSSKDDKEANLCFMAN